MWLRDAGGGFVTFIALICAIFILVFYVTHTQIDEYMAESKWQVAVSNLLNIFSLNLGVSKLTLVALGSKLTHR